MNRESPPEEQDVSIEEEERKNIIDSIEKQVGQGVLDSHYRKVELDPKEFEKRTTILRDYINLVIETTSPIGKDVIQVGSMRAPVYKDLSREKLEQIAFAAYDLGLTHNEIYHLSDNQDWHQVVFHARLSG